MSKHERFGVADKKPAIGSSIVNPRFDVAQIATRGHVLSARIEWLTNKLVLPSVVAAVVIVATGFGLIGNSGFLSQSHGFSGYQGGWLQQALIYDPNSYFDIGGGLKGGPEVAWLGKYKPTPESLSLVEYGELTAAVVADQRAVGNDAANWQNVAALKVAPMITRPERVFSEHSAHLKNGVVALPEDGNAPIIVAYVGGEWAVAAMRGDCTVYLGPLPEGCADARQNSDNKGVWPIGLTEGFNQFMPKE